MILDGRLVSRLALIPALALGVPHNGGHTEAPCEVPDTPNWTI